MPFITGMLSVVQYSACSVLISAVFRRLNTLLARKGHFMQGFACYLLAGICYVLMCKYAMRATDHVGYVCITYITVMAAAVLFISSRYFKVSENTRLFWPAMIAFAVVLLLVQYHFDPVLNKVDRWSAIANPITYLLHGEFPYMAKTHLGGNASPSRCGYSFTCRSISSAMSVSRRFSPPCSSCTASSGSTADARP